MIFKIQGGAYFFANVIIAAKLFEDHYCLFVEDKIIRVYVDEDDAITKDDALFLEHQELGSILNHKSIFSNPDLAYEIFNWDNSAEINGIVKALDLKKNHKILDVGCGYGRNLLPLLKAGFDIDGIDINLPEIRFLKQQTKNFNQCQTFCAKIDEFIIPDRYDAAFSALNTVRYLESHWHFYRHMNCMTESLKSNGLYLFNCSIPDNPEMPVSQSWQYNFNGQSFKIIWSRVAFDFLKNQIIDKVELFSSNGLKVHEEYQHQTHYTLSFLSDFFAQTDWELIKSFDNSFNPINEQLATGGTFWILAKNAIKI